MSGKHRPVTILIAAMGGEGGGVLTSWIVSAARRHDLPVQAVSVPGVAQRTGATNYYIEVVPTPYAKLKGKQPVMDLYPGPGDIDLMVATELIETGRMVERGYVSPDRTTLVASVHRVYTLAEKMDMADGRYDGDKVLQAAKSMAKRTIMFDMERAARDAGSIINAVILGAMAGSDILPIPLERFEESIREGGIAVESNLAGFAAGLAYARGEIVQVEPEAKGRGPAPDATPADKRAAALRARIEKDYPKAAHAIVLEAAGRVLDYQDARYAHMYLDRLDEILAIDQGAKSKDFKLTIETARHLALRMAYEDIARVAQLKTRASRMARVRREVEAAPDQLVVVTEFLKPGAEEFCSFLPSFLARPILRWAEKSPSRRERTHVAMHVKTSTILGFLRVRMVAGLRRIRRLGHRYKTEQALIQTWLDLVKEAAAKDRALAFEIVECARLIKGYGETHRRGVGNFTRIADAVVEPAIAGKKKAAALVKQAREAALADPEGETVARVLADAGVAAAPAAAE